MSVWPQKQGVAMCAERRRDSEIDRGNDRQVLEEEGLVATVGAWKRSR